MSHLTHGALCNGIGGFALAAQWAGIHTRWTVENDPFCNAVSRKHFPHAEQHHDLYHARHLRHVDIISAGYPCQPESYAGKRGGENDDRWLWPQVLRVLTECRPGWFIGENVAGHLTLGLAGVLADLEGEGYEVWPLVLPACATGAPHRRDRVWIIAHAHQPGWEEQHPAAVAGRPELAARCADALAADTYSSRSGAGQPRRPETGQEADHSLTPDTSSSNQDGRREGLGWWQQCAESLSSGVRHQQDFPLTEPPLCAPDDGLSGRLVRPDGRGTTPGPGRAKSLETTWRRSTLHAAGNALVPQIPTLFFQFIAGYEAGLLHS